MLVLANLASFAEDEKKKSLALIELLNNEKASVREKAAESLIDRDAGDIVPGLKKRAESENDFHVQLALHYALAMHGEKKRSAYWSNLSNNAAIWVLIT